MVIDSTSAPHATSIRTWLHDAAKLLTAAGIPSASLDAQIILAHILHENRTWLHAHDDTILDKHFEKIADTCLQLRLNRTPIAYITGYKEFYGRSFKVDPSVLIPRPESEEIITTLKKLRSPACDEWLIDVGTGSGCLGITAKLEIPRLRVTLSDISHHALRLTKYNAAQLKADVTITQRDLLEHTPAIYNIIIANLPYVDVAWKRSPETDFEPKIALFAEEGGLATITRLISQAAKKLARNGLLILEADPVQHDTIVRYAVSHHFQHCDTTGYSITLIHT